MYSLTKIILKDGNIALRSDDGVNPYHHTPIDFIEDISKYDSSVSLNEQAPFIFNIDGEEFAIKRTDTHIIMASTNSYENVQEVTFDDFFQLLPITPTPEEPLIHREVSEERLNTLELIDELNAAGAIIDSYELVTVYYRTSAAAANEIYQTGIMKANEDGLFFSTVENGQNVGYGEAVITLQVPASVLRLDDIFANEAHLRIPLQYNQREFDVSDYLIKPTEQTEEKKEPTKQTLQVGSLLYTKTPVQAADLKEVNKFFMVTQVNDDGTFQALALTSNLTMEKYKDSFMLHADKVNRLPKDSIVRTNKEYMFPGNWKYTKLSGKITLEQMQEISKTQASYKEKNKIELVKVDELTNSDIEKTRDKVQELYDTFQSDPSKLADYLVFSAKFHNYSARNQALLYAQNEGVTFVAGKHKYKELGYEVNPDAMPLSIMRPSKYEYFIRNNEVVPVQKATKEEKEKIKSKAIEVRTKMNYFPVHVYDISQTSCPVEDYPKLFSKGYDNEHHKTLSDMMIALSESAGIPVEIKDIGSISIHGYYSLNEKKIVLNELLNDTSRLNTICHEFAHAMLHHSSRQPTSILEFEAEALACVLMSTYGLEASQNNVEYMVSHYNKAAKDPSFNLGESLARIHKQVKYVNERVVWTPEVEQYHQQTKQHEISKSVDPLLNNISDSQVFLMK